MAKKIPSYKPPGSSSPMPRYQPPRQVQEFDMIGKTRFTSTRLWKKFRRAFLAEHPLCVDCNQYGITTEASQVHHIVKRANDTDLAFEPTNCMALCASCHSKRTGRGE